MKRYWFTFNKSQSTVLPYGVAMGCGITAFNLEDAKSILLQKVFNSKIIDLSYEVIEDININELDRNHVIPNMLSPSIRGVWYPIGYL